MTGSMSFDNLSSFASQMKTSESFYGSTDFTDLNAELSQPHTTGIDSSCLTTTASLLQQVPTNMSSSSAGVRTSRSALGNLSSRGGDEGGNNKPFGLGKLNAQL